MSTSNSALCLIVDDDPDFIDGAMSVLASHGFEVCGISPLNPKPYGSAGSHKEVITRARVIFLDHNMGTWRGNTWLEHWRKQKVNFSKKVIIGTSRDPQPYAQEQTSLRAESMIEIATKILRQKTKTSRRK